MTTTLIHCRDRQVFDAVARELTDWRTEYTVLPQAFQFILPGSSIFGVRQFLDARSVNTANIFFYTTEEDD